MHRRVQVLAIEFPDFVIGTVLATQAFWDHIIGAASKSRS